MGRATLRWETDCQGECCAAAVATDRATRDCFVPTMLAFSIRSNTFDDGDTIHGLRIANRLRVWVQLAAFERCIQFESSQRRGPAERDG